MTHTVASVFALAMSGASAIQCPPAILADAFVKAPVGFTAYADGQPPHPNASSPVRVRLAAVLFSDGPPQLQQYLLPQTGTRQVPVWHFIDDRLGIWLTCRYAATGLMLARPLPPAITSCEVRLGGIFSTVCR